MNWKDDIVAIFTPTTVGEEMGVIGTGVPIGNDLLLTARHVVRPDGRAQAPIRLVRFYKSGADRSPPELDDKELIVWECRTFDVALLRCPQLPSSTILLLNSVQPDDGAVWCSEGFPSASKIENLRKPGSFSGTAHPKADAERYFEVHASADKQPDNIEGWKGASGMPVIVDGRIVGVVTGVIPGSGKGTIKAAPAWQLLKNTEFRRHIPSQDKIEKYIEKMSSILVDLMTIDNFSRKILKIVRNDHQSLFILLSEDKYSNFIEKIMFMNKSSIIDLFRKLNEFDEGARDVSESKKFQKLTNLIWPVLFCIDRSTTNKLYEAAAQNQPVLLDAPVGTLTMAELLSAFAGGRPTDFVLRDSNYDYPAGRHWIPVNFQVGNDEHGGGVVRSVLHTLGARMSINRESLPIGITPGEVMKAFFATRVSSEPDFKSINVLMRQAEKRGEPLPYLACVLPENPNERAYLLEEFRELQKALPLLHIIGLDPTYQAEEIELLEGFNIILPGKRS